jgi:hypothetical protein
MRRTTRTLFMAAVLLLTLGVAAPAQAGKADPVPIKGVEVPITAQDVIPDPRCPDYEPANPFGWGQDFTLDVKWSHLGRGTAEGYHCYVFDSWVDATTAKLLLLGPATVIAANGDQLWLEKAPDFTLLVHFDDAGNVVASEAFGDVYIVGGTGRFDGATGTLHAVAPDMGGAITLSGEIAYDASNRAAK